jgi:hypothetical protein
MFWGKNHRSKSSTNKIENRKPTLNVERKLFTCALLMDMRNTSFDSRQFSTLAFVFNKSHNQNSTMKLTLILLSTSLAFPALREVTPGAISTEVPTAEVMNRICAQPCMKQYNELAVDNPITSYCAAITVV